jgi:uncharacterized caspase-like protein
MHRLSSCVTRFASRIVRNYASRPPELSYLLLLASLTVASPASGQQATTPSGSAPQVALIIGNADYPDADAPLRHPVNDARVLAEELRRRGFDVAIGENLTKEGMRSALDAFYARIRPGSAALVYFSGYGIQSQKQSYLIPVSAQIWNESHVRRDGIDLQSILDEMNIRRAGLKIAILDAARANPFERRFRGLSQGLAPVSGEKGSLVIYAAAPNKLVEDGGGEHGLFARELLKEIRAPGATVEQAFSRTRGRVSRASKGEQVPWVSSHLGEDVQIGSGSGDGPDKLPPPPPKVTAAPPRDPCAHAEVHWKSAETIATKAALQDHLKRFAS